MPILLKIFQKISDERILPKSVYEATTTLKPKLGKNITKKGNYRPKLLMSIDAKILNNILANRILKHMKNIIYHDQVGFISGIQGLFKCANLFTHQCDTHINKLKDKKHNNFNRYRKNFNKIQHTFIIKTSQKWA